ncbi:MAG: bifunctional [glutamate--ammonia ligase]-adenylyl-L-tyrosine phosphorylase/[glutamate--ammonia-ligase] adenylyltransferase [Gammaproteobacteria bacterium]
MDPFLELPAALQEVARRNWSRLADPPPLAELPGVATVFACSDFIAGAAAAEPGLLHGFITVGFDTVLDRTHHERALMAELGVLAPDGDPEPVVRHYRRSQLARIAWRDLAGLATLETTLEELSDLADACIAAALGFAEAALIDRHGVPRDADGRPQRLVVLAMGKLGAHELNLSSDIDLIFAWPESGTTDGERAISNEEFFDRLGKRLVRALESYRVDMRLRPFGDSGPLTLSFGALESYYQEHGRDWERYALIKARAVTGEPGDGARVLALLRPFVYRRYLDYGSFEQLRRMKAKIAREVARQELADNVKLGPGGIREVEFIGQAYQLIRGGREPALQDRSILRVLGLLAERRHLEAAAVDSLTDAYRFLRRVENRLQAQGDQQVHELPVDDLGRARLARAMAFPAWDEFSVALAQVRGAVTAQFEGVFFGHESAPADHNVWRHEEGAAAGSALAEAGFSDAARVAARLLELRRGSYWRAIGDAGRARLDQLIPAALDAAAVQPNPDETLYRLLKVIEAIDRRISYLALMVESPNALKHLARLCSASSLVADRVARTPLLLDELLDPRIFTDPPTREALIDELRQMMFGLPADDLERQMDAMRAFYHGAVLRIAVADLTDMLPLMKVSDRLTDVAELIIGHALALAQAQLAAKNGAPQGEFVVIAYGKLGGLELAYGSDLDLVFLHDAAEDTVLFARLAQRIVHLLSTPTAAGPLYEVDTRLRPSGASGLLVSTIAAFESYQSSEAWTWEHQALLRARPVAGSAELGDAFRRIRRDVLTRPRDAATLRDEVATMRARMRAELGAARAGLFDLKQDVGGIADIEFLVQYLVLENAADHSTLVEWPDNIRQLDALVESGVLGSEMGGRLADAYRALRERVHRLGLKGEAARVPDSEFTAERKFVQALWNERFGAIIAP